MNSIHSHVLSLALVVTGLSAHSATVVGDLHDGTLGDPVDATLIFQPQLTPLGNGNMTYLDVTKKTNVVGGVWSMNLVGGIYVVEAQPYGRNIVIFVPIDSTNTYQFNTVADINLMLSTGGGTVLATNYYNITNITEITTNYEATVTYTNMLVETPWPGPTNGWSVATNCWFYAAYTPCAVVGFTDIVEGTTNNPSLLTISNATATNISFMLPTGVRLPVGVSNYITISPTNLLITSVQVINGKTNAVPREFGSAAVGAGPTPPPEPTFPTANLYLWNKPETLSGANGSKIPSWFDSTGNNRYASNTVATANRPFVTNNVINGYEGAVCGNDGSENCWFDVPNGKGAFRNTSVATICVVQRRITTSGLNVGWNWTVGGGTTRRLCFAEVGSQTEGRLRITRSDGGTVDGSDDVPMDTKWTAWIFQVDWGNTRCIIRTNGVVAVTDESFGNSAGVTSNTDSAHASIGADYDGSDSDKVIYSEFIIWREFLDSTKIDQVESYLTNKFGAFSAWASY